MVVSRTISDKKTMVEILEINNKGQNKNWC